MLKNEVLVKKWQGFAPVFIEAKKLCGLLQPDRLHPLASFRGPCYGAYTRQAA
jgi:hypothetical protein